jgi:hypothetical protein
MSATLLVLERVAPGFARLLRVTGHSEFGWARAEMPLPSAREHTRFCSETGMRPNVGGDREPVTLHRRSALAFTVDGPPDQAGLPRQPIRI